MVHGRGFFRAYLANNFKKKEQSHSSTTVTYLLPLRTSGRFYIFRFPDVICLRILKEAGRIPFNGPKTARSLPVRLVRKAQHVSPFSLPRPSPQNSVKSWAFPFLPSVPSLPRPHENANVHPCLTHGFFELFGILFSTHPIAVCIRYQPAAYRESRHLAQCR